MNCDTNWKNEKPAEGSKWLQKGGYVCQILSATDNPERQFLTIAFEICEGEHKDYFVTLHRKYGGNRKQNRLYKSYKDNCKDVFKSFLDDVEGSNPGYVFNNDENTLAGKYIGVIFSEEEYLKDGEVKVALKATKTATVQKIREGKFKVPDLKKLPADQIPKPAFTQIEGADEDLPF